MIIKKLLTENSLVKKIQVTFLDDEEGLLDSPKFMLNRFS